jgi:alanine racemase
MTPASPIRPTEARVDLEALAHNHRLLRVEMGPRVGILAVVKADAYGHGAVPIARLLEGLGVFGFGVATVEEGVELREAGLRSRILVLGAAFGRDHAEVVARDLTPVVGDPGDVARFAEAAHGAGRVRFGVHVKVDTGMTRLGVEAGELEPFLRLCARHPAIRVDGLATHFAVADEKDPAGTDLQLARFVACLDRARAMGADPQLIHAANSAAALRFPRTRFDLVRTGLALYGSVPSRFVPDPGLLPVLSLTTRINAIRHVPAGTGVSYGWTARLDRPSVVATLPLGYADGYPRSASNRAQVLVRGRRAPLVGTVCMDLCMVDVTDVPGVEVGDAVTLLGRDGEASIAPGELAAWAGGIVYEITSGLSRRVPRTYPGLDDELREAGDRAADHRGGPGAPRPAAGGEPRA